MGQGIVWYTPRTCVRRASSPRGSRDDNDDKTRALMTIYCPYIL